MSNNDTINDNEIINYTDDMYLTQQHMNHMLQKGHIVGTTGSDTGKVMSQKAITDQLATKINKSALNGNSTPTATSFYAPTSAGKVGRILVGADAGNPPKWIGGNITLHSQVYSGTYFGDGVHAFFITAYGREKQQYGSLWINSVECDEMNGTVYNSRLVANAEGEDGFWGRSMLCISAFIPCGHKAFVGFNAMKNNSNVENAVSVAITTLS